MRRLIPVVMLVALTSSACGGGGGESSSTPVAEDPGTVYAQNQLPIIVDAGPANTVNVPFVSLTICSPGTKSCQTIDHIILDTGSSGLRIMASVLSSSLALSAVQASNGTPLVECMKFADRYSWGPVRSADLTLGGETVSSLAIQVIGDVSFSSVPSSCSSAGRSANTVQSFGGNGILGVGVFQHDCGSACANSVSPGIYYTCTGATCQSISVALQQQVHNPVALLANDNNGVLIELPPVSAAGADSAGGTLTLGIGTQANNGLGNASVFGLNILTGTLTTRFNGTDYYGFFDSGSNALFLEDGTTTVCSSGFYCPASAQQLTAINTGTNGMSGTVSFSVLNADTLLSSGNVAFNNLAAPAIGMPYFDWGLPFFFGRRIFTAIEGRSTPGGSGPYVAY